MKPVVIVIAGTTASGKTSLSIELAKKINGEIVSADSMQIYKYMDIGSAKPTKEEMQGIKHYMIDFVEPNRRYSVADYKRQATESIKEILKKGKVPIVVGGTRFIHKFSYIHIINMNLCMEDVKCRCTVICRRLWVRKDLQSKRFTYKQVYQEIRYPIFTMTKHRIDYETVEKLCSLFDCSLDELFEVCK